jgi:hypothetical protein
VLGDVLRHYGKPSSARLAWLSIKSHFVRLSDNNRTFMLKKLQDLEPGVTESMESFLNRCAKLRNDFAEYDLVLEDHLLITQVLSKLSIQWKTRAGLDGKPYDSLVWEEVALALQGEDNARRQSNTKSPEALLPLGWTRRTAGEARPAAGGCEPSGKPSHIPKGHPSTSSPALAAPAAGRPAGPRNAPHVANPQGEPKVSVPVVCWHCQNLGHLWPECQVKPEKWRPTAADRAKGEAKREELRRRKLQGEKDRAAHAAKAATQGEGPSDARASGAL